MNQRFPSGPAMIFMGPLPGYVLNNVTEPVGVILPTLLAINCVNQILPSGPTATLWVLPSVGKLVSGGSLSGKINRPILEPPNSMNQMFPSTPGVIALGALPGCKSLNSVITPAGVILPSLLP